MLDLDAVTKEFINAKPAYLMISPNPSSLLKGKLLPLTYKAITITTGAVHTLRKGGHPADVVGGIIGTRIIKKATKPINKKVTQAHLHTRKINHDRSRKNGLGGRSWIDKPGRYEMVIVYHDANRAGKHIDIHIGRLSVIYRVKPDLASKLKLNNKGYLTENSRNLIISHVRDEINNSSRVPQNLDHTVTNARVQWVDGDPLAKHYGAGKTRQIVNKSMVDVYKAHPGGPIEIYAPVLNPHGGMYIFRLYSGTDKRAPILIWGNKSNALPDLEDRLHLKMIDPREMDKLLTKADMSTSTAKYDGSSCYVIIGPKGTTVWSPRHSSKTGERIEYTFKLEGLANTTSDKVIIGMGELVFRTKTTYPWQKSVYLSSSAGAGLLNSNEVLPSDVVPEIRLYRIDKIGRTKLGDIDFWSNRKVQEQVAKLSPNHLKVVELMDPDEALAQGYEGVVAVPPEGNVNSGFKMKWWLDPHDWRIDKVNFRPGDKGGLAGVVELTSLDSGKKFKLGPNQIGDRKLTEHMMREPYLYEGTVLKVSSRHGHEGRAAKVLDIHQDKGNSPF